MEHVKQLYVRYRYHFITCILIGVAVIAASFSNPNEARISNGLISVRLLLPDAVNGYYRGVRFDRSGIIASLAYKGHSYFGQWFKTYMPTKDDAIMGPVEAFDPLGYDEAKPGEQFVKIGVGILIKPDSMAYRFSRNYPLVDTGKWQIQAKANEVQFTHTLTHTAYAYQYRKTVKLINHEPIMVLSHTLINTGKRTIQTQAFDHNFFVIDNQPTGPGFTVTLPVDVSGITNNKPDYVTLQGHQLIYTKELNNQFVSFTDLTGGKGAGNYDLKIENHHTGAAVRITADRPISKLVFWSAAKTLCPEPYINIRVEPGQTFTWNITYQFYSCNTIKL